MMHVLCRFAALAAMAIFLCACASFPETRQLQRVDSATGYRYANLEQAPGSDELFVMVTFSGGGTRAAALSLGVLEKLRDTWVTIDGQQRNLLREIDVISSVSGGSFTAAYFALNGDDIFARQGRFQQRFLYNDVEKQLLYRVLNPYNWVRMLSPTFGRIEIADELYQALLFDNATYHDLMRQKDRPFIMVNATDMTKGYRFAFIQSQFDPICADLNSVTIARAVAASSNFPVAFTPLALNSYPDTCQYTEPAWVNMALTDLHANPRRYYRAKRLRMYQEPGRKYVHLLDGGVSDNIGLRGPLASMRSGDVDWSVLNKINLEQIQKLVVIVVDAKSGMSPPYDEEPSAPGLVSIVNAIATTPLDNYSFDTVELLKDTIRRRIDAQRVQPDLAQVDFYRIYVGFDQIADPAERERFFNIKTTFNLPADEIDALRVMAGTLLEQSACFQSLVGTPGADDQNRCNF